MLFSCPFFILFSINKSMLWIFVGKGDVISSVRVVSRVNTDHSPNNNLPEQGRKVWAYTAGGKCTKQWWPHTIDINSLKLTKLISRLQWCHTAQVSMALKVIYLVSEAVSEHQHPPCRIYGSHWNDRVPGGNLETVKRRLLFEVPRWALATDTSVLGSQDLSPSFSPEVVWLEALEPWEMQFCMLLPLCYCLF